MKKFTLLMAVLALLLLLSVPAGFTLAYLTDTDTSATFFEVIPAASQEEPEEALPEEPEDTSLEEPEDTSPEDSEEPPEETPEP